MMHADFCVSMIKKWFWLDSPAEYSQEGFWLVSLLTRIKYFTLLVRLNKLPGLANKEEGNN